MISLAKAGVSRRQYTHDVGQEPIKFNTHHSGRTARLGSQMDGDKGRRVGMRSRERGIVAMPRPPRRLASILGICDSRPQGSEGFEMRKQKTLRGGAWLSVR